MAILQHPCCYSNHWYRLLLNCFWSAVCFSVCITIPSVLIFLIKYLGIWFCFLTLSRIGFVWSSRAWGAWNYTILLYVWQWNFYTIIVHLMWMCYIDITDGISICWLCHHVTSLFRHLKLHHVIKLHTCKLTQYLEITQNVNKANKLNKKVCNAQHQKLSFYGDIVCDQSINSAKFFQINFWKSQNLILYSYFYM